VTAPHIENPSSTISTLERRKTHLQGRVENPPHGNYVTSGSINYDRAEIAALEAAIKAVAYIAQER
jgi:hypothetical protein